MDATKKVRLDVDTNLTTGNQRLIYVADQNIDMTPDTGDYASTGKGVTNGDTHDHSGGDGAQIDHGGLAGLTDYADHPGFTLIDGTRAFTGNIDIGANNITNVGTVDGVDVSANVSGYIAGSLRQDLTVCVGLAGFIAQSSKAVTLPFTYNSTSTYAAFACNNSATAAAITKITHDSTTQITIYLSASITGNVAWETRGY
jgi:hypothetical protein